MAVPTYDSANGRRYQRGRTDRRRSRRTCDRRELRDRPHARPSAGRLRLDRRPRPHRGGGTRARCRHHLCARVQLEGSDPRIRAAVTIGGSLAGDASGYFAGVATPLLAIHGDADTTYPIEGATELYALANPPKFLVTLLGADGNSPFATAGDPALRVVEETTVDFFTAYLRGRASGLATARPRRQGGRGRQDQEHVSLSRER